MDVESKLRKKILRTLWVFFYVTQKMTAKFPLEEIGKGMIVDMIYMWMLNDSSLCMLDDLSVCVDDLSVCT